MIVLLIFGGYGGSIQPIRIFSLAVIPISIIFYARSKIVSLRNLLTFIAIIYLYMVVSLMWTSDPTQGQKEVVYYLSHFSILLTIPVFYSKAKRPLRAILLGWIILVLLTQIIAIGELFFNLHLSISKIASNYITGPPNHTYLRRFASVTYGNFNTYVVILCFAFPFIYGGLKYTHKKRNKFILLLSILFAFFTIYENYSRGGIIVGILIFALFGWFYIKNKITFIFTIGLLAIPLIFLLFLNSTSNIFLDYSQTKTPNTFLDGNSRYIIWEHAIDVFKAHPLFGAGIGSMIHEMSLQKSYIFPTHNLFLEILIQYGILILFLFISFLITIFHKAISAPKKIKVIVFSGLLTFPLVAIINSGYLLHPFLWVYLGSLFSLVFLPNKITK